MKLIGYSDRLSVCPGQTIKFMVSCDNETYTSNLVRLIHGDQNPDGPGFKEKRIASTMSGEYSGRTQLINTGSYLHVSDDSALQLTSSFTLTAWIFPTTPGKRIQGLMTKGSPSTGGYGLTLEDQGDLGLWMDNGAGNSGTVSTGVPLISGRWYFVAASYNANSKRVVLCQIPLRNRELDKSYKNLNIGVDMHPSGAIGRPFVMAAWDGIDRGAGDAFGHHFNGKLDQPRIYNCSLSRDELDTICTLKTPNNFSEFNVASWDFSKEMGSSNVIDTGPNRLTGRVINLPARAMTGHNWDGTVFNFNEAPGQYGAIYFHDDDFEDAGWEADFDFTVPKNLESGVYAAKLQSGSDEEYLPFFVRPIQGRTTAKIAVLFPTLTYITYANFHDLSDGLWDPDRIPNANSGLHLEQYDYIMQNDMTSLYDKHSDGSGTCYSSRLRPILNMRPKHRYRIWNAPARFAADLYMIDWLDAKGYKADVITDEDIHNEGISLLTNYKVVITGSHPEYWTSQMLDGLDGYLESGGRLMYLGGNGFYGVLTVDPKRPYFVELRRWGGSWPFELPSGERYHNTTGQPGGIWRNRGVPPQQLVGVGSCSAGFDSGSYYVRQPGSYQERVKFIFEGIGDDERLGDFPSLVMKFGAAGYEMDRLDHGLGTPDHALLLASSVGHSELYQPFREDAGREIITKAGNKDQPHPFIRSDIVYFETPSGGAVFSVGSIGFRGSLSYNQYDNNISRMIENVLSKFQADDWSS